MDMDEVRKIWMAFRQTTYRESSPKQDLPLLKYASKVDESLERFIDGNGFIPREDVDQIEVNFSIIEDRWDEIPSAGLPYFERLAKLVAAVRERY